MPALTIRFEQLIRDGVVKDQADVVWLQSYERIANRKDRLGDIVSELDSIRLPVHYSQEVLTELLLICCKQIQGGAWSLL